MKAVTELNIITKGEMKALQCDEPLAVKWYSSKIVYLLSTIHDETTMHVIRRNRLDAIKPSCVVHYNSKMGAVDKQDAMIEPYDATRKTLWWYKKLIIHLLQISLLNAFLRHQKDGGKLDFLQYQGHVILDLLTTGITRPAEALVPDDINIAVEEFCRLKDRHFIMKVLQTEKRGNKSAKRCKVCSFKGVHQESTYMCGHCPSQPGLCVMPCFKDYHTKISDWQ